MAAAGAAGDKKNTAATVTSARRHPDRDAGHERPVADKGRRAQWGLFGGAIENLGTERHHGGLRKIIDLQTAGLLRDDRDRPRLRRQSLETTPTTQPPKSSSSTPHPSSRKDYHRQGRPKPPIIAAVFAQLITPTENHGVHCFVVPIRDDDGDDLPGHHRRLPVQGRAARSTTAASCSTVRVPRENLLNKVRRRLAGRVVLVAHRIPAGGSSPCWAPWSADRVTVAAAGAAARVALDIATRYALQRRQFETPTPTSEDRHHGLPGTPAPLLPLIAKSVRAAVRQNELVATTHDLTDRRRP